MATEKKAALGVGLAALAGGILLLTKKKPPEAPPEGAEVVIQIFDAQGNLVPSNSPVPVIEGESYQAVTTVTNKTTRAGEPWEATLSVELSLVDGYGERVYKDTKSSHFDPGQTIGSPTFVFPFTIPVGAGGETWVVVAVVRSPDGKEINRDTESLEVQVGEIIYGADIIIGV